MAVSRLTQPRTPEPAPPGAAPPIEPEDQAAADAAAQAEAERLEAAQIAEGELIEDEQPEEPAPTHPNRGGRPRGGRKNPTESTKLWDFLDEIGESEYAEHYKTYVYRMEPFTQPNAQEHKYCTRYDQIFDTETMKRELGSGKYYLRMNRKSSLSAGRSGGGNTPVLAESIVIEDPNFPPNIPPGPWLEDPRNKKWAAWFKPKPQQTDAPAQATQSPRELVGAIKDLMGIMRPNEPRQSQDNITTAVIEAMKTSHNEAFQMFKENSTGMDPVKMMTLLMTMIDKLAPKPAAGNDTMTAYLLDELKASREQSNNLLQQILHDKKTATDPLESIQQTLHTISAIQEATGKTAGGFDWKTIAVESIGKLGTALAPVIPALIAGAQRNAQTPPPGQRQTQQPIQAGAQASAQAGAQADTQATQDQTGQGEEEDAQMMLMFRGFIAQVAPAMLHKLNSNAGGMDFADWLIDGYGMFAYQQVKGAGKERILQAIHGMPELMEQLQPIAEEFDRFLDEFLSWTPPDQEDSPEPETVEATLIEATPAPSPAAPPKPATKKATKKAGK